MDRDRLSKDNICYETNFGIYYVGNNVDIMKNSIPNNFVDLVITSPPYDNIYTYHKDVEEFNNFWNFEVFKNVAKELYRVVKEGGMVVWIVNDSVKDFNESGTSFRQALYFKEIGFNLYDTMIYYKKNIPIPYDSYYYQKFEYMFVFSKGRPKTLNFIKDYRVTHTKEIKRISGRRDKKGNIVKVKQYSGGSLYAKRGNVWKYDSGYFKNTKDKIAYKHPAIFPEALVKDHIISWTNEGDIILDPFMGSGTTAKMSEILNRYWIGIDINKDYCDIARKRIEKYSKFKLL